MPEVARPSRRRLRWSRTFGALALRGLPLTSIVLLSLAPPSGAAAPLRSAPTTTTTTTTSTTTIAAAPAAIRSSAFLSRREIRRRLDLARQLTTYDLAPTNRQPIPDPDCATAGHPEATAAVVHPAARTRTQSFEYDVPGRPWALQGRVLVLEYPSAAQARAAFDRARSSVRGTRGYVLTCEAINPIVSGQRQVRSPDVEARSFSWRYHLRAGHAGSWRDIIATDDARVVWVELGRVFRADLDWTVTPPAQFPRYVSKQSLANLAEGAITKGL